MKKLLSIVLTIIIIVLTFTACKKGEPSSSPSLQSADSSKSLSSSNPFPSSETSSQDSSSEIPPSPTSAVPQSSKIQSSEPKVASTSPSAADVNSCVPPDNFECTSLNAFISWIKNNGNQKVEYSPFTTKISNNEKILIAKSKVSGLNPDYYTAFTDEWKVGDRILYSIDFATNTEEKMSDNQRFSIHFYQLSSSEAECNLAQIVKIIRPSDFSDFIHSTHNGLDCYYREYQAKTDTTLRQVPTAIFKKDKYAIAIESLWCNQKKPWSNEYFDMFDFEYVSIK